MIRPLFPAFAVLILAACRENLSPPPPTGLGKDTVGPLVVLTPGRDTTVDSTGVLRITVDLSDQSGIRFVDFLFLSPTPQSFGRLSPFDTVYAVQYPIQLGSHKHSTFRFYVRTTDVLDHETITDTVVVTVR